MFEDYFESWSNEIDRLSDLCDEEMGFGSGEIEDN